MDNILKQRLIGALILVALAVVFWPIIFVDPEQAVLPEKVDIPERPMIDRTPIAEPSPEGLREAQPYAAREAEAEAENGVAEEFADKVEYQESSAPTPPSAADNLKTRVQPPVKPQLDEQGVPIAWILQVASFRSEEKSEEARLKLLEMGYKAYVETVRKNGERLYRVYVGPKFEKARLEPIKSRVDTAFAVKSIIKRYVP